jgi:hypothetical protein
MYIAFTAYMMLNRLNVHAKLRHPLTLLAYNLSYVHAKSKHPLKPQVHKHSHSSHNETLLIQSVTDGRVFRYNRNL